MFKMKNKKGLSIIIKIFLLILNFDKFISSLLPIGINQLNYFIYLDRFKYFTYQNLMKKCSLSNGPNCYYMENKRYIRYKKKNEQLSDIEPKINDILDIQKQWMYIYDKSQNFDYLNAMNELYTYISDYTKYISSKNDSEQIPAPLNLRISIKICKI